MSGIVHTKVNTGELGTSMANIESSMAVAENALNAIDGAIMGKLRPTWGGDASETFFRLYAADAQNYREFVKNLRRLNEQLRTAATLYDRAETEAVSLVNSIQV